MPGSNRHVDPGAVQLVVARGMLTPSAMDDELERSQFSPDGLEYGKFLEALELASHVNAGERPAGRFAFGETFTGSGSLLPSSGCSRGTHLHKRRGDSLDEPPRFRGARDTESADIVRPHSLRGEQSGVFPYRTSPASISHVGFPGANDPGRRRVQSEDRGRSPVWEFRLRG